MALPTNYYNTDTGPASRRALNKCLTGFYLFTQSASCNRLNKISAGVMQGRLRAFCIFSGRFDEESTPAQGLTLVRWCAQLQKLNAVLITELVIDR